MIIYHVISNNILLSHKRRSPGEVVCSIINVMFFMQIYAFNCINYYCRCILEITTTSPSPGTLNVKFLFRSLFHVLEFLLRKTPVAEPCVVKSV